MNNGPNLGTILLVVNIVAYAAGHLLGWLSNRMAGREVTRPRNLGITFVLIVAVLSLGLLASSAPPIPSESDAGVVFEHGVASGQLFGTLIGPSLMVLFAVAIISRLRRKKSPTHPAVTPQEAPTAHRSLGTRIATYIFWTIGIFLLLVLSLALLAG